MFILMQAVTLYMRGIGLIAQEIGGQKYYYICNAHGDITCRISETGDATPEYIYDAFGNLRDESETDPNPFKYCGEYWDKETGTYYLRNRCYSPGNGRFTSEDPIRSGLNWYSYCGGNPIVFSDPTGLFSLGDIFNGIKNAAKAVGNAVSSAWDKAASYVRGFADTAISAGGGFIHGIGEALGTIPNIKVAAPPNQTAHTVGKIIGNAVAGVAGTIVGTGAAGITVGSTGALAVVAAPAAVAGYAAAASSIAAFTKNAASLISGSGGSGNNRYIAGRPAGGNPTVDSLVRRDKGKYISDEFVDFLNEQGINPDKWNYYMETWETPDGIFYERHYWTNGVQSFYHL
jgi:RHS repeat-associated protein